MTRVRQRYSGWCQRQASAARCSPLVTGVAGAFVLVVVLGGYAEIRVHLAGFLQGVRDVAAMAACTVALVLARGAMRVVAGVPQPPAPEYESPVILAARGDALADAWCELPATREEAEAALDALRAGCAARQALPVPVPVLADEDGQAPEVPEGAPGMAAEAEALADGLLGVVVSAHGTIYELAEPEDTR